MIVSENNKNFDEKMVDRFEEWDDDVREIGKTPNDDVKDFQVRMSQRAYHILTPQMS